MYLKKTKTSKGRIYLQIVSGYRDEAGKSTNKVIKSIGYLDEYEKIYDDPIKHFTDVAKQIEKEEKDLRTIHLSSDKEMDSTESAFRNVGYLTLKPLINKLGIENLCKALSAQNKGQSNLYDIVTFLIYSQIIEPGSKQNAYHKRSRFLENYDFSLQQLYRSLSVFGDSFEMIIDYLYRQTEKSFGLDTKTTFYDGTNFYFEIDREDDFRKKGPCKDGTNNPLVSIGLLVDANHIPIDIRIYSGNESEKPHYTKVIKEMKEKNKIKGKTIYIADKGLNTSNNIYTALHQNDGYIFSQTIKGATKQLKDFILNQNGYENILDENNEISYKLKWYVDQKSELVVDTDTFKGKKIHTKKMVITWSRQYAEKSAHERAKIIKKANHIINYPSQYKRDQLGIASSYIKELKYNNNGEIIEESSKLQLDTEKINEDALLDGYYLIVTSEDYLSASEILKYYKRLSPIEELFRVSKTFLNIRPVFLQRENRIKAHVLVSYIAVLLLRLLQSRVLKDTVSYYKTIEAIREYNCAMIKKDVYFFFKRNQVIEELAKHSQGNAKLETQSLSQIKNLFKEYK